MTITASIYIGGLILSAQKGHKQKGTVGEFNFNFNFKTFVRLADI